MGARYVVDAAGKIVEEEVFAPSVDFKRVPWQKPPAARTPTPAPASGLRWFRTCGDAVCKDGGYRGPHANIPRCQQQKAGTSCRTRGTQCDLANNCNMLLVCTATDPAQRCAR